MRFAAYLALIGMLVGGFVSVGLLLHAGITGETIIKDTEMFALGMTMFLAICAFLNIGLWSKVNKWK